MAHAPVQVGQGQLGAGMRAFPTDGDPCAVRIVGEGDHTGQLGGLRTGAEAAELLKRGVPDVLGPARITRRTGSVTGYPTE
ncbi:hypothetical protein [Streptomyces sp. OE57]|uniref:hypothetical protein n=1 Tax=Streptomyces lacaronensis TaxID=3379885 RepID=UPI0039B76B2F